MSHKKLSGAEIRQTFIDFFLEHGHTFVPSASLVPGGDATLLFTNSGMVQFKDVFIGTDKRPYTRAVNSQKCMRVAGKHNDLDDVGRDDTHHTFFEMLGNWSFGDYYKKEAITWSWQLLTEAFGIPKENLYATCFKDDQGNVPTDEEAAAIWRTQPGFDPSHVLFFGRKENFWQMAEVGPCGPCSEIHIDRGLEYCDMQGQDHVCAVNGDCKRFLELWNNVFIQYNLFEDGRLEPLAATHVDTGMGFERIVSVIQDVSSNYRTDLLWPLVQKTQSLSGQTDAEREANFTPYRVIADHVRSASFLIADGVVPGNVGRNYVCRMIVRRAARFGTKIGLHKPFLAQVAEEVIRIYGDFYPELVKARGAILDNLTREEKRFARTIETGIALLQNMLDELVKSKSTVLDGRKAFELYATCGLPFEITRDIAREQNLDVDESGFRAGMEEHRLASGGGKAMGAMGGEDAEFYAGIFKSLTTAGKLPATGVEYDPYESLQVDGEVLSLVVDGQAVESAQFGDVVEVVLPKTGFYIASGGQVADSGFIRGDGWEIEINDMRKPSAGLIIHVGEVISGKPKVGDKAKAEVNAVQRHDIMRNHTATHLMHAALHKVLGEHARQAGSLVAPDRLRFDFNHPEGMTAEQLERVEWLVNEAIAADMPVVSKIKPREEAIADGAMALFGEKYGESVRTITIQQGAERYSYELCGGTHLNRTSDVGAFLIVSEGSAAAGVRRLEAVTGRGAYELIARRFKMLRQSAAALKTSIDEVPAKIETLQADLVAARKQAAQLRGQLASTSFESHLQKAMLVKGSTLLAIELPDVDKETLAQLADQFREKYPENAACVIVSSGENIIVMAAVTQDLIKRGIKAGDLVSHISKQLGAGGGGAPHLAFGGGKDTSQLNTVLASLPAWLEAKL